MSSQEIIDELTVFYETATCHLLFLSLCSESLCSQMLKNYQKKKTTPPHNSQRRHDADLQDKHVCSALSFILNFDRRTSPYMYGQSQKGSRDKAEVT